ncbi:MAG: DUF6597 domain-containing transcriptional factor [Pseudomonadota bacterium]
MRRGGGAGCGGTWSGARVGGGRRRVEDARHLRWKKRDPWDPVGSPPRRRQPARRRRSTPVARCGRCAGWSARGLTMGCSSIGASRRMRRWPIWSNTTGSCAGRVGGLPAHTARTLPHPCVHWTFKAHTGAGTITGVQTRLWQRDLGPAGEVLGIKFRPAGFRPWFGRSLHGLRDRVLPAVEVLAVRVAGCWRSVSGPLVDPPAPGYPLLP